MHINSVLGRATHGSFGSYRCGHASVLELLSTQNEWHFVFELIVLLCKGIMVEATTVSSPNAEGPTARLVLLKVKRWQMPQIAS